MSRPPPEFDARFRSDFEALLRWRRDVRRFSTRPVEPRVLDTIIASMALAPSVGLSQPTRLVRVDDPARRAVVVRTFERENDLAAREYAPDRAAHYASLKLAGLREAPVHLAVFADEDTVVGHGLGRRSMPETLRYSSVTAIHTLWLSARAWNVGMGWVSILDPVAVHHALDVPDHWCFVAYLCLGYPLEEHEDPELERHGWEERRPQLGVPLQR